MSHYTWHNVTESSRVTTKYMIFVLLLSAQVALSLDQSIISQFELFLGCLFRHAFATLSFIAEVFLFLYVGTDALDIEKWKFVSDRFVIF